jgi:hypothetical protein
LNSNVSNCSNELGWRNDDNQSCRSRRVYLYYMGPIQIILGQKKKNPVERLQSLCIKKIIPRITILLKSITLNPSSQASTRYDGERYLVQRMPSASRTTHAWRRTAYMAPIE